MTSIETKPRVYCAGPLFNASERREMTEIADVLAEDGYPVFLPHRDGMEFRKVHHVLVERGFDEAESGQFLHSAIFALDVYQLAEACDAMVWNLNGRVPDEGAVSEAAIAWTLGKPLIAYSDDARSLIVGRVNPLLVGLVDFQTTDELSRIPELLSAAISSSAYQHHANGTLSDKLNRAIDSGGHLWNAMTDRHAQNDDEAIADVVVELFGTKPQPAE